MLLVGKRQRKQFGLNSSFGRNGLCCCFETMMDILLNWLNLTSANDWWAVETNVVGLAGLWPVMWRRVWNTFLGCGWSSTISKGNSRHQRHGTLRKIGFLFVRSGLLSTAFWTQGAHFCGHPISWYSKISSISNSWCLWLMCLNSLDLNLFFFLGGVWQESWGCHRILGEMEGSWIWWSYMGSRRWCGPISDWNH